MRVKVDYRSGGREAYKLFCQAHPKIKLSFNEWVEIIYGYNEEFRNHLLETGDREKLPLGLGPFSIKKKKRKMKKQAPDGKMYMNLPIDWKKTREKGKKIYNFNHHTDGYFFGWLWFKKQSRIWFSSVWRFKPSRVSSRMINHYIKADEKYQHIYKEW